MKTKICCFFLILLLTAGTCMIAIPGPDELMKTSLIDQTPEKIVFGQSTKSKDIAGRWSVTRITYNDFNDLLLNQYTSYYHSYHMYSLQNGHLAWSNWDARYIDTTAYFYDGKNVINVSAKLPASPEGSIPVWDKFDGSNFLFHGGNLYNGITDTLTTFPEWFVPSDLHNGRVIGLGRVPHNATGTDDTYGVEVFTWSEGGFSQLTHNVFSYYNPQLKKKVWVDPCEESYPIIYNKTIAWVSHNTSDPPDVYHIFLSINGTVNSTKIKCPMSPGYSAPGLLQIEDGRVLYVLCNEKPGEEQEELYLYNGTTVQPIGNGKLTRTGRGYWNMHNGQVVWQEDDGNNTRIYLYNGSTIKKLTANDANNDTYPIINNGYVVWSSWAPSGYERLWIYNGTGAKEIPYSSGAAQVSLWNGQVAFRSYPPNPDMHVYFYDERLNATVSLTSGFTAECPVLDNGWIAWVEQTDDDNDGKADDYEVFMGKPFYGYVTDGFGHMLEDVKVSLIWNGKNYTDYTDSNGMFSFVTDDTFKVGSSLQGYLYVEFADRPCKGPDGTTSYLRIFDESSDLTHPVWFKKEFKLDKPENTVQIINASRTDEIVASNTPEYRLEDLAAIYYHSYEAAKFAEKTLGLRMDHALPVDVYAWNPGGTRYGIAASTIFISTNNGDSLYTSGNRPDNREWHEFSHHIMFDSAIGNNTIPPWWAGNNHNGYSNPDSSDSWIEGFAEFMSMVIADHRKEPNPQMYKSWGRDINLERNCEVWRNEEFAVAGILWDLYDGTSAVDDDAIDLELHEIWNILNNASIHTLKGIYDAFADSGLISLTDLNRTFVAHDAFDDTNGNLIYNFGEPVGTTSWGIVWSDNNGNGAYDAGEAARVVSHGYALHGNERWSPPFPHHNRPSTPPINGSYILVNFIDNITGEPIDNVELVIREENSPPYDIYDRNYTIAVPKSGTKVYLVMPPGNSTMIYITPTKDGHKVSETIFINSTFYWNTMLANHYLLNGSLEYLSNQTFNILESASLPDLQIQSADISFSSNTPIEGDNVTITAIVRSTNLAQNETITVEVLVNNVLKENRTVIVSSIETTMHFNWTAISGAHNISFKIDSTNVANETNETNNIATKHISVSFRSVQQSSAVEFPWLIIGVAFAVPVVFVFAALWILQNRRTGRGRGKV